MTLLEGRCGHQMLARLQQTFHHRDRGPRLFCQGGLNQTRRRRDVQEADGLVVSGTEEGGGDVLHGGSSKVLRYLQATGDLQNASPGTGRPPWADPPGPAGL